MNGGIEIKENDGGGRIQLPYTVRTFVNATMFPQYNNIIKNKKIHRQEENICKSYD
jgi:hypothetical protein